MLLLRHSYNIRYIIRIIFVMHKMDIEFERIENMLTPLLRYTEFAFDRFASYSHPFRRQRGSFIGINH